LIKTFGEPTATTGRSADTGRRSDEPTLCQVLASLRRNCPEDQLALRVWMRDIILGRKVGSANTVRARRSEKRMVEACERRILELGMAAREVTKELKREGWYAWASDYESIVFRIKRVRAKAEN
jgi:hypothetical protein